MKGHHVNAEALAMYREGLLGRRAAARIRAHLPGCSHCAEVHAGLAEVPALLAHTSAPPMPAELTARIEAALATESAARRGVAGRLADATQPTASPVSPASRAPQPPPAPRRRTLRGRPGVARRVLAFAATVAVVVAGGGYLLSRLPSGPSGTSSSSAAGPATAERPAPQVRGQSNADGTFTTISSGTNYRPGHLAAQVATVLSQHASPGEQAPTKQAPTKQAPTEQAPAPAGLGALAGCVARIAAGQRPRLVDVSRYDGRAATIIVLPATAQAPSQVWVVGAGCSAARSDVITHTALAGTG